MDERPPSTPELPWTIQIDPVTGQLLQTRSALATNPRTPRTETAATVNTQQLAYPRSNHDVQQWPSEGSTQMTGSQRRRSRSPEFGEVPMFSPQQMRRNYRRQSNSRDVGNTYYGRQLPVQPEYHSAHGTTQNYEAVDTTRLAPRRGHPAPWNVDLPLFGQIVPPMFPYTGPTQYPNSAAQNAPLSNISGINNSGYGNQAWEGYQTGNVNVQDYQPGDIRDTRIGNRFSAQNEHLNSSRLPSQYEYARSLSDTLSGNRSGAPNQHRPWSDGRSPSHDIGDTPYDVQLGARYEYANDNTQPSQLLGNSGDAAAPLNEGTQAFRPSRLSNVSLIDPSARYNTLLQGNPGNVLPSAGARRVPSRAQPLVHNRLSESNLRNLPPQDEVDWKLDEDDDPQPTPKKQRRSTRGPLVDAPHAALQVPDCDLTASDIFCLFPKYYLRSALMKRFVNNGWQAKDIADAMNYSRGVNVTPQMIYNGSMKAVRKQMKRDGEKEVPDGNMRIASTDLPARTQDELPNDTTKLYDLARCVHHWPRGRFITPVTETVKWCLDNEEFDYTLAQLPQLIRQLGYRQQPQANGQNLDQEYRDWIKFHFGRSHQPCPKCTPR